MKQLNYHIVNPVVLGNSQKGLDLEKWERV